MKQHFHVAVPDVPKCGCIALDALADQAFALPNCTLWAYAHTAFTNAKTKPIGACMVMVMTRPATDVAISRQHFIVKQ